MSKKGSSLCSVTLISLQSLSKAVVYPSIYGNMFRQLRMLKQICQSLQKRSFPRAEINGIPVQDSFEFLFTAISCIISITYLPSLQSCRWFLKETDRKKGISLQRVR